MRPTARLLTLTLAFAVTTSGAFAKSNLRIGLGDDPDGLDPTTSRFYTTRIVFAALCDKLFDIDEKGNIVPQLALGAETSADGKTVTMKLRPGVKFHDGEPFDAAAAKYSLDRHLTMKGSFRRSEISVVGNLVGNYTELSELMKLAAQGKVELTTRAYQLDQIQSEDYDGVSDPSAVTGALPTVRNVRLIDPAVVSPTVNNLQQLRGFYSFADTLDVDRYDLKDSDGSTTQREAVVAVRELNLAGIPTNSHNFANDHTVYTHGQGFVAAYGNVTDQFGNPSFFEYNIPPQGLLLGLVDS